MSGFVKLHRGWMDNPALGGRREPFCKRSAWAWLIENARWQAGAEDVMGRTVMIERGQLTYSQRYLAEAWNWDEKRVRRFLGRLEADAMIASDSASGQRIITICNYSRYQDISDNIASASASDAPHQRLADASNKKKGRREEYKKEDSANPPSSGDDGEPELFASATVTRLKSSTDVEDAVAAWNVMAAGCGLAQVQKITDARRRALLQRLRDCGGLEGWANALEMVRTNDFLTGRTERGGWVASFDFLLQPSSFTKLLEGAYRQSASGPTAKSNSWMLAEMSGGFSSVPDDPFTFDGEYASL